MGKIYGENLWGKLMVLFNIANLLKNIAEITMTMTGKIRYKVGP